MSASCHTAAASGNASSERSSDPSNHRTRDVNQTNGGVNHAHTIPTADVVTTSSGRIHKVPARFQLDPSDSDSPSPDVNASSSSSYASLTTASVTRTPNNKLALHVESIKNEIDSMKCEEVSNKRKRSPNSKYIELEDASSSEKKESMSRPISSRSDGEVTQKEASRKMSGEYRKIMAPQHEETHPKPKRGSTSRDTSPHHDTPFHFPPFPDHVPNCQMEDAFAPFYAQTDRSLKAQTLSKVEAIKTSLSPSSQSLHSVRLQIYKELSEEYFGRYMKETSDSVEEETRVGRGAQRTSGRVTKSSLDRKETPEQLRMIFFEQYNKSEGDRVPSSAGCSSKTGIVMVNPLPTSQYLKSLSASHAASLSQLASVGTIGPSEFFPPTLDEFQSAHYQAKRGDPARPTAMNPHFDLFQYAPTVITDQYEVMYDEIDQQLMQAGSEHPTLPLFDEHKPHIIQQQQQQHEQEESKQEQQTSPQPSQPSQTQLVDDGTPREPNADATMAACESINHDLLEPTINGQCVSVKLDASEEKSYVKPATRPLYEITNPFVPQVDEPAPNSAVTESCPMSDETHTMLDVKVAPNEQVETIDSSLPSKAESELSNGSISAADASAPISSAINTSPDGAANDVTMTDSTVSSPGVAHKRRGRKSKSLAAPIVGYVSNDNMPSAPSAPETESIPLPTKSALSLPSTKHGVGMFGGLDFGSPHCDQFKSHWTNGCYSWKFDPKSKLFSGFAYSGRSKNKEDVSTVISILQNSQADFHHQLMADELEEQTFEDSLTASKVIDEPRSKRIKRELQEADTKEESQTYHTLDRARYSQSGTYSSGSPEYNSLKNRIRSSFEDSMHRSLFLPHTYLREVAPRLHGHAIRMSQECVKDLYQKFHVERDEEDMDDALKLIIPGFGCRGTQVFLKIGLCVTLLHDEIAWCSALNYMTVRSRGCALWIGLNVHKASVKWPKEKIRQLINATNFNLCEFLQQMKKSGLQPSMQLQYPGTCIYSPQGKGSAHIVITVGSWVEQIAINHGMSPSGIRAAMSFWDGVPPLLHNSALATRCVIPLLWLQKFKNWELGMAEQLCVLAAIESQVNAEPVGSHKVTYRNYNNSNDQEMYCQKCFNQNSNRRAILFMSIDSMCPACFVDVKPDYAHFANMLDRRLK